MNRTKLVNNFVLVFFIILFVIASITAYYESSIGELTEVEMLLVVVALVLFFIFILWCVYAIRKYELCMIN